MDSHQLRDYTEENLANLPGYQTGSLKIDRRENYAKVSYDILPSVKIQIITLLAISGVGGIFLSGNSMIISIAAIAAIFVLGVLTLPKKVINYFELNNETFLGETAQDAAQNAISKGIEFFLNEDFMKAENFFEAAYSVSMEFDNVKNSYFLHLKKIIIERKLMNSKKFDDFECNKALAMCVVTKLMIEGMKLMNCNEMDLANEKFSNALEKCENEEMKHLIIRKKLFLMSNRHIPTIQEKIDQIKERKYEYKRYEYKRYGYINEYKSSKRLIQYTFKKSQEDHTLMESNSLPKM